MLRSEVSLKPYLEIRNLSHHYGHSLALKDVSLQLEQNKILALIGPSGSGKSTLLAAIAGIVNPYAGEILLDGCDLLELPPETRGLGMVFQDYALWPHMTVAQNLEFPLRARKKFAREEIDKRVGDALKRVGLRGFERRRPHELSGGQQQRVALARAIVGETRLLLLDEPLSALDPATRLSVRGELADLLRILNLTTVIVTHDREEAFELADRVALLVDGEIQQHGLAQEIYERPANLIVARFMGVNLLRVYMIGGREARILGISGHLQLPGSYTPGAAHVTIAPERTRIVDASWEAKNVFRGQLLKAQYRGGEYRVRVRLGLGGANIEARSKIRPIGDGVYVHLPVENIYVLETKPEGGRRTQVRDSGVSHLSLEFEEEHT